MTAWRDRLTVIVVFLVSRVLLRAFGIRFDTDNLAEFWQLLDPLWLRNDLWGSLFYLHAQPPLFNLLVGAAMGLFGERWDAAVGLVYEMATAGGLLGFLSLARRLGGSRFLALGLTLLLAVAPATLLFENKLYYEGLTVWLLVSGLALLAHWWDGAGWAGPAGFAALAATVLLRSAFHPIWLAAVIAGLLWADPRRWRRTVAAALVPGLLVGAVMLKNELVFGSSALSSWGGINLARMMIEPLPAALRSALIASGKMSGFAAIRPFSNAEAYQAVTGSLPDTGIIVLDATEKTGGWTNYNNQIFVLAGRALMHDSLVAMAAYPQGYLTRLATAFYHFNRPPSEFRGLEANLAPIAQWDRLYSLVIEGQPAALFGTALDARRPQSPLYQPGLINLLVLLLAIGAAIRILWRLVWYGEERASLAVPAAIALSVLYAIAATNALDVWENNRARFMIEPLMILVILWLVRSTRRKA